MIDPWLPRGYHIHGWKIKQVACAGTDWQIYRTEQAGDDLLLMAAPLGETLMAQGFLKSGLLASIRIGAADRYYLAGGTIFSLAGCPAPDTFIDAKAVALALRQSRQADQEVSLAGAIYVEKYSLLLPTAGAATFVGDDLVLGQYLTGGIPLSVFAFSRLAEICSWLTEEQLRDIINAAGLSLPAGCGEAAERTNHRAVIKGTGPFSLPGRPALETFFNEHIIDIVRHEEKYRRMGIDFPSATILYGPPGCGKTYAVQRLVEYLGWPSFTIDANSVGSPYIHQTGKLIAELFAKAQEKAPSVIIIDEMEAFVSARDSGGSQQYHVEEVSEFLRLIPEAVQNKVLIFAMTNRLDMVDTAIRRTGRFDNLVEVTFPGKEEAAALIQHLLQDLPVSDTLHTEHLIDAVTGKPLSDVDYVIREAARLAAKQDKECIDQECLDLATAAFEDRKRTHRGSPFQDRSFS